MPFQSFLELESVVPVTEKVEKKKPKKQKEDKRGCEFCPLNKVHGVNKIMGTIRGRRILLFAQSPGPVENAEGRELLGPAGKWFWREMRRVGLTRADVDIQNAVRCFPADSIKNSYRTYLKMRNPTAVEIKCCSIYNEQAIQQSEAKLILILGKVAALSVLQTRSLPENKIFWSEKLGAKVFLVDHPAFFVRGYGKGPRLKAFRSVLGSLVSDWSGKSSQESLSDDYAYLREQHYYLIKTREAAEKSVARLRHYAKQGERTSVDIEGDDSGATACGFSPKPGLAYTFDLSVPEVAEQAKQVLEDGAVKKVMHHGCTDVLSLRKTGMRVRGYDHDTNLSEYLRFSDYTSYKLDVLAENRFSGFSGYKTIIADDMLEGVDVPDAVAKGTAAVRYKYVQKKRLFDIRKLKPDTLRLYNGADADVCKRIEMDNRSHVPQALMKLYIDLSFVLQEMEPNGPEFDYQQHEQLAMIYPLREKIILHKLQELAGSKNFKPGSPVQVGKLLYETLKLRFPYAGKPNTQKMTLLMLGKASKAPGLVLEWRAVSKVKSTYLDSYEACAKVNNDRLRTKWWACLPAGELVLTNRGYLPIEDVRKNDRVLSHRGKSRRVVATVNNGVHPLVKVTLSNGLTLRTTYNHRYLIEGVWVEAGELKLGMQATVYGEPEVWKSIAGFPGYRISSWGRVFSEKTQMIRRSIKKGRYGHRQVDLWNGDNKWSVHFPVHRLVANAFLAPAAVDIKKPEIRHLNGLAWVNVVGNLCWGTRQENALDASRHGSNCGNSAVTAESIKYIRSVPYYRGMDFDLAEDLGISRCSVRDIRRGRYHTEDITGKRTSFTTATVIKIEAQAPEQTYGLEVAKDASHVTGGIVTHNTGARTGRLSSGGGKKGTEDAGKYVNLQNIKKDVQTQNMLVADVNWRAAFQLIGDVIKRLGAPLRRWWEACDREDATARKEDRKPEYPEQSPACRQAAKLILEALAKLLEGPLRKLRTFLILDFGQLEIRVLAQLSGDKNLIRDCMSADIHTTVGTVMTGWSAERIRNDEATRTLTKNVHFGLVFGLSKTGLFEFVVAMSPPDMQGRVTEEQVNEAHDRYFERYRGVRRYIEKQRAIGRRDKCVETLFGMKQTLEVREEDEEDVGELVESGGDGKRGSYWGNQAVNGPVQGTAHQLMICGLVNLRRRRKKYSLLGIPPMEVHDALYFNVEVYQLMEAYKLSKYLLEQESLNTVKSDFPEINWEVPVVVDAKAGIRLGTKVKVSEKTTPAQYLLDWWRVCDRQMEALDQELRDLSAHRLSLSA